MSWLDKLIAVTSQLNGTAVATRPVMNFSGLAVTDDATNGRVNVQSGFVYVGAYSSSDYTLTSQEASTTNLLIAGGWDGAGYTVNFPPASAFVADTRTTVTNSTDQAVNFTDGTTFTSIPCGATVVLSWTGTTFAVEQSFGGAEADTSAGWTLQFTVAAGVATRAFYSRAVMSTSTAAKNGAGDFTITFSGIPAGKQIRAAHCTPNTTAGLDPKAVITGADTVRCYMTADSDFTVTVYVA